MLWEQIFCSPFLFHKYNCLVAEKKKKEIKAKYIQHPFLNSCFISITIIISNILIYISALLSFRYIINLVILAFLFMLWICNGLYIYISIFLQRARYFADVNNALEWALYITSLLFAIPFLFQESAYWQWETGAIAVFLAWFNCLVFLQRY